MLILIFPPQGTINNRGKKKVVMKNLNPRVCAMWMNHQSLHQVKQKIFLILCHQKEFWDVIWLEEELSWKQFCNNIYLQNSDEHESQVNGMKRYFRFVRFSITKA
jgi:hypothetical protein